ncbi:MAG TPA: PilZ domain-containing protein [Thermoanaerobaculia bacterium]|nr:PilZ domain-containing protein [Thermoanaerobaculia bacterium]
MSPKNAMDAIRRSNRFRVIMNVPLRIGLKQATLVDISTTGVLATHSGTLKTDSTVQISFTHEGQKFAAQAKVASCTVVGLGAGEAGATLYASRLYFENLPDPERKMLEDMVGDT